MFLTAFTAFCSLLHWGLGIITGAFLAREMGRRIPRVDYPLLVACAFIGMGAGNLGIFASDPLVIRRAGYFLEKAAGIAPSTEGSWSLITLMGFILGLVAVTVLMGLICPEESEAFPLPPNYWSGLSGRIRPKKSLSPQRGRYARGGRCPWACG